MNSIIRFFCCISILLLCACATQQNNTTLGQCKAVCSQKLQACANQCVDNCRTCSLKSSYSSAKNHTKYVHEKRIEGTIVARELNSYRDPLQCRKITCSCAADFNTCTQNCTGIIQKQLRGVPYCT